MKTGSITVVGPVFFEVFVPPVLPPPGEEIYVEQIHVSTGGSLNPASVATALGARVTLMYPSGDGLLDIAISTAIERLKVHSITWPCRPNGFVTIVHSVSGDRSFVSHADEDAFSRCPEIPDCDFVYIGGVKEAFALWERVEAARARGARVAVTGCWSTEHLKRLTEIRCQPWDLLVLNRKEATLAAGEALAAPYVLEGCAADIVVTDGEHGAFGRIDGQEVQSEAFPADVVDLTGAGDAFAASLVVATIRDLTPAERISFACRVASRVVGIYGGTVTDPELLAGI